MTAKTKKTPSGVSVIKKTAISGGVGMLVTLAVSLITAWAAMKLGEPLSLATTMAAICVLCGAMSAAIMGSISGKSLLSGVYAGAFYTVVCVIASLCTVNTEGSPLLQIGAAALGTLGGIAISRSRKGNAKKHLKKYVKR